MSDVVFLADVQDLSTPATVYGKGHLASIADEAFVHALVRDGKAALTGALVRNPRVAPIAATTATISWEVDQPATSMAVNYGTTTAYGSTQAAVPPAGSGTVVASLTGLTTATVYHYRITVTVGTSVTLTPDATFTTA